MTETLVRRSKDGRVIRPADREPHCVHSTSIFTVTQPASACRFCRDGVPLRRWKAEWAAWSEENPDTWQARAYRGESQ